MHTQITNVVDEHWEEKEGPRCSKLGRGRFLRKPSSRHLKHLNFSSTTGDQEPSTNEWKLISVGPWADLETRSPGARDLLMWFVHFCMKTTDTSEYNIRQRFLSYFSHPLVSILDENPIKFRMEIHSSVTELLHKHGPVCMRYDK